MATPGWYPDPGGAPDLYRYWDGTDWSHQTTQDPRKPSPSTGSGHGGTGSRRPALLLAGVIVLAIAIVVTVVVVRDTRTATGPEDPLPTSTVGGWDDSSPFPSGPPEPSGDPSAPLVRCPPGNSGQRVDHPSDGRVHGGNLSFPIEPSYDPATDEPRLSFAYDVAQQDKSVNPRPAWIAQLAVGRLRAADGFTQDARNTAESVVECSVSGGMYRPYGPTRKDVRSEKTSIDGHDGWLIETDVTVTSEGLPFPGDHVIFIVVEDGDDWGLFFGAVPIGDDEHRQILDRTVAALTAL